MSDLHVGPGVSPSPFDPNHAHYAGIHFWRGLLGCLRRAGIDDGGDDATFGTHLHDALRAYHLGEDPTGYLSSDPIDRSCSEMDLFTRYATIRPVGAYGRIELSETRLHGGLQVRNCPTCGPATGMSLGCPLCSEPIAGTLDLVTTMDVSAVCAFERMTGMLLEPGRYLHDYKTKKQHTNTTAQELRESDQATMYEALLRQTHPEWSADLKGVLFHLLYRYVKPNPDQIRTIFVPLASEGANARLRGVIRDGAARLQQYGPAHVTPVHCFDWFRSCPLLDSNACNRTNAEPSPALDNVPAE